MHALIPSHTQEHTKEETSAPMLASVKKSDSDTNLREKFAAGATTFSYHKKRKTEVLPSTPPTPHPPLSPLSFILAFIINSLIAPAIRNHLPDSICSPESPADGKYQVRARAQDA
jgi:hypothetical protein